MSTETVYHCDNHVDKSYAWDREKAESRHPVKAGWFSAFSLEGAGSPVIQIKRMGDSILPNDKHFCSHKCLIAWITDQLPLIKEETVEQPKEEVSK